MKFFKRLFITLLLLGILAGGTVFYAKNIEPNLLTIKQVPLSTRTGAPLKIVFFSDTHFGSLYDQTRLEKIVEKINAQQADLVVFGGDFIDGYLRDAELLDLDYLAEQLDRIEARYAKIAVWGNHDYGGGSVHIYEELMANGGFTLLRNERIVLEEAGVSVTGLDDLLLGTQRMPEEPLPEDCFNLLVSHEPDMIDSAELAGIDLVLAGHSHGGQVLLPYLTERVLPPGAQNYRKGAYPLKNERGGELFVSSGLGMTQMPYRFLNPPEIVVVEAAPNHK